MLSLFAISKICCGSTIDNTTITGYSAENVALHGMINDKLSDGLRRVYYNDEDDEVYVVNTKRYIDGNYNCSRGYFRARNNKNIACDRNRVATNGFVTSKMNTQHHKTNKRKENLVKESRINTKSRANCMAANTSSYHAVHSYPCNSLGQPQPPINRFLDALHEMTILRMPIVLYFIIHAPPFLLLFLIYLLTRSGKNFYDYTVVRSFGKIVKNFSIDESCTICLSIFEQCEIIELRCGHFYHRTCVEKWLRRNGICPLCRSVMF